MVHTIKEAAAKSAHCASITDLPRHISDWLLAFNYVKQLKALHFKTRFEAILTMLVLPCRSRCYYRSIV